MDWRQNIMQPFFQLWVNWTYYYYYYLTTTGQRKNETFTSTRKQMKWWSVSGQKYSRCNHASMQSSTEKLSHRGYLADMLSVVDFWFWTLLTHINDQQFWPPLGHRDSSRMYPQKTVILAFFCEPLIQSLKHLVQHTGRTPKTIHQTLFVSFS